MTTTLDKPELPKANRSQLAFVRGIRNQAEVLSAIAAGHDRIKAAGDSPELIAVAKFDTECELADLEGDDVAMAIVEQVWGGETAEPMAAAAAA